jgi:hypothetical protein
MLSEIKGKLPSFYFETRMCMYLPAHLNVVFCFLAMDLLVDLYRLPNMTPKNKEMKNHEDRVEHFDWQLQLLQGKHHYCMGSIGTMTSSRFQ